MGNGRGSRIVKRVVDLLNWGEQLKMAISNAAATTIRLPSDGLNNVGSHYLHLFQGPPTFGARKW
jgi:hypothetical protein